MNKDEFEEEKHKALTGGSEEKPTPAEDHAIPSEDDEPIYDLPPDVANEVRVVLLMWPIATNPFL